MTVTPLEEVLTTITNWENGGRTSCLKLLVDLVAQPDAKADICEAVQCLITSILPSFTPSKAATPPSIDRPTLAGFLQEFIQSVPSTSNGITPNHYDALSDIIIDAIYALDDVLEDRADKSAPPEQDRVTLGSLVNDLVRADILPIEKCRERLFLALPFHAGIVNLPAFDRKEVRLRTDLIYKQNKFNLLREQSEGYTKLIVEVIASMGPAHSPSTKLPIEPMSIIRARASAAWSKVVSLVGYFDLDPNRALDVILDVFSSHIITHYVFFLELFKYSPWSRFPPLPRFADESMDVDSGKGRYAGMEFDDVVLMAEKAAQTEEAEPSKEVSMVHAKPEVCSQILGFKFQHYARISEPPPESLFMMTALLIRERFIEIKDLLPHLAPTEEGMAKQETAYNTGLREAVNAAKTSSSGPENALHKAQPLSDDSVRGPRSGPAPAASTKAPAKKMLSEPRTENLNHRVGLLKALLATGTLRPALFILGKYQWLPKRYPTVADLIINLLQHMVSPLYESVSMQTRHAERIAVYLKPKAKHIPGVGLTEPTPPRDVPTIQAPLGFSTNSTSLSFFYPSWTDWVPVCSTKSELTNVLDPMMRLVAYQLYRDRTYLSKLCRIAKGDLSPPSSQSAETESSPYRTLWIEVTRRYLLPALSTLRDCPAFTIQVWNVIRLLTSSEKWGLYAEWKHKIYRRSVELELRQVEARRDTKRVFQRINVIKGSHSSSMHTNGRPLGKLAHSNPCIVFDIAVHQIQAYDNFVDPVVETMKSLTVMGYDVLMFVLLDAFSNTEKARMKDDGTNTSAWLMSLSSFTGQLLKRFPLIGPKDMMRYVVNQLRNHQIGDYVILRDIISRMTGIEPLKDMSTPIILAMGGGPTLRVEAVASELRGALQTKLGAVIKARDRLIQSLTHPSDPLALPLLVLLAQQRQACVYRVPESDLNLKGVASLNDDVQGVLFQYLEFLTTALGPQNYANLLPSVVDLVQKYGLDASIAMHIHRPRLHEAILAHALEAQQKLDAVKAGESAEDAEKRLRMEAKAALAAKRDSPAPAVKPLLPDGAESSGEKTENATPTLNNWLPMLQPLIEEAKQILPHEALNMMGAAFYVTFWQLSGYDINPPMERYREESARITKLITPTIRTQDRERYTSTIESLSKELKTHLTARQFTIKRLHREKAHWFPSDSALDGHMGMLTAQVIQHCFWPRAVLSPMDADFCSQFIKSLHSMGTPGFSTLRAYDRLLGDHLGAVAFSCTQGEARNWGRFLSGLLKEAAVWHEDENLYNSENKDKRGGPLPGFKFRPANGGAAELMAWKTFQNVHNKWHKKVSGQLVACLDSDEYMHVYNAIIILQELIEVFPMASVNVAAGTYIEGAVQDLVKRESLKPAREQREDLKVFAGAYLARLLKRKLSWAPPDENSSKADSATQPAVDAVRAKVPAPNSPRPVNGSAPARTVNSVAPATVHPLPPNPSRPQADMTIDRATAARIAIESIPRPEVVKRVRKSEAESTHSAPSTPPMTGSILQDYSGTNGANVAMDISDSKPPLNTPAARAPPQGPKKEIPQGPKRDIPQGPKKDLAVRSDAEASNRMPPPIAPSSTTVAHELRHRSSALPLRDEKQDGKQGDSRPRDRLTPSSPRRRSPTPPNRSRNASVDSRRRPSGRDGRDDERDRDRENNRERERDGHRERDRGRERERERGDGRDRDDRHRREPEKDRGERDSHPHDRRDRDRESLSRNASMPPLQPRATAPEDPSRMQDQPRRSGPGSDDNPNKRRRPVDDDPDRNSKRTTRHRVEREREGHRESGTRHRDKDRHRDTDSSRNKAPRKDRDSRDEGTGSDKDRAKDKLLDSSERNPEQLSDAKLPEKPRGLDSSKQPTQLPPSAPRAMAARGESPTRSRNDHPPSGRDSRPAWKGGRDAHDYHPNGNGHSLPSGPAASRVPSSGNVNTEPAPSLRSRLGEDPRPSQSTSGPPSGRPSERESGHGDRNNPSLRDDPARQADNGKKRTISDRSKDDRGKDADSAEIHPTKRPRLNRVFKYSLDVVHDHLGEKGGRGRKDSLA